MVATLLKGEAVVEDIEKWCARIGRDESNNGDYDNVQPVMAVVWFDTDPYAAEYVRVKADVAAKAGVGYWVYRMPDTAATDKVIAHIQELNRDDRIHGILVQRPVPDYLSQERIMGSVSKAKHIEEYTGGRPDNIASDSMVRLISKYNRQDLLKTGRVRIAGHGNIVTDEFIDEMRRTYPRVRTSPDWPVPKLDAERESMLEADGGIKDTVLITELQHGGGYITPAMVGPSVEMIIDLGFHIVKEAKMGDADPELLERDGLAISPTPGGMLPVLIWVMMERTIKAKLAQSQKSWGCMCQ